MEWCIGKRELVGGLVLIGGLRFGFAYVYAAAIATAYITHMVLND